ncbi:MAG: DUF1294 domain-containing protein [Oscillospiraceae bacterium]|nr:DUF1294 domain-containing protein [Oscillospiraceae bacterium]
MPTLSAPLWKYVLILLAVMSAFLFVLMAADKGKARRGAWRVSEKTLFVFALLGGAVGGTAGMFVFRHKTKHLQFRLFFPLLAAAQLALCAWLYFKK